MKEITPIRATSEGILRLFFSEPPLTGHSPAIFCDRDGVINERIRGGYVTQWSEFRFIEGIEQALAELSTFGLPLIVVSNQAGVGKGVVSPEALAQITESFVSSLGNQGAKVDAVYYCPHVPEARCSCRKPATGLLRQAAEDWRIDLGRSVLIGDSASDLQAAQTSRCQAILLAPDHGHEVFENVLKVHEPAGFPAAVHQLIPGMRGKRSGEASAMAQWQK
jgi:D-glycero-D-manno-heptose 1,7-bisphosphate phosphatase